MARKVMDRRGRAGYGMGLIADRGLEIVLLRVLNPAGHAKVRRGMSWIGMVWCG